MKSIVIALMFGIAVVALTSTISDIYLDVSAASDQPAVETIDPPIDNSILDYDFTPAVYEIPPRYSRGGVNPFTEIESEKPKIVIVKVEKKRIVIPSTPLTRWVLPQLNLTGVVITSKSALAFFTGPNNGKAYTGKIGDYIGRAGIKIHNITTGVVHLSNGSKLVVNQ